MKTSHSTTGLKILPFHANVHLCIHFREHGERWESIANMMESRLGILCKHSDIAGPVRPDITDSCFNIIIMLIHSAASSNDLLDTHTTQTQTNEVRWGACFSGH